MTGFLWIGCNDKLADTVFKEPQKQTVSPYDGQPIIEMSGLNFYQGNYFEGWSRRLVATHGNELLTALNEQTIKAQSSGRSGFRTILIKDLMAGTKAKTGTFSTHLRLTDPDGETEEFMLGVRRYVQNPAAAYAKTLGGSILSDSDTWLALSPDRFYLQDDDRGNELWPVTFPAVNLADNNRQIEVTFDTNGFVSATGAHNKAAAAGTESPNLMLVEAVPIVEPNDVEPCDPCGGGGGIYRRDDNSRGDDPSIDAYAYGTQTYFVITSIMLATDGDGAAELQMFLQESDDYTGLNMPLKYRYRLDNAYRADPTCDCSVPSNNTMIYGADGKVYDVPDVNLADYNYTFNTERWTKQYGFNGTWWESQPVNYFALIALSYHPEAWRLLMSDDDKDYPKFSRRRQSEYDADIQTYHMNSGSYAAINTGFTVEEKTYGSSDDPQFHSGVRRITESNALNRQNLNGDIIASKPTSNGTFRYVFGLASY